MCHLNFRRSAMGVFDASPVQKSRRGQENERLRLPRLLTRAPKDAVNCQTAGPLSGRLRDALSGRNSPAGAFWGHQKTRRSENQPDAANDCGNYQPIVELLLFIEGFQVLIRSKLNFLEN